MERSSGFRGGDRHKTFARRLLCVPFLAPLSLLVLAIATLLGSCLIGTDRLAFRDVSHFYTPLYGSLARQERSQWLPLYNDADHVGIPLGGETTTALFYPLRRFVFWLVESPEPAIAWYVALHLLIAGITVAWAANRAGATNAGASIAMVAYPLTGPIWFLYTNPPFLAGAAWLPLALGGGFALLRSFCLSDLLVTSSALALMTLAGDPQSAIHVVLVGASCWFGKLIHGIIPGNGQSITAAIAQSIGGLGRMTMAVCLSALLAAPQLAASIDWAPQSVRYLERDTVAQAEIFAFSVAPWHWLEFIVPSISGNLFPKYSRISHLLPGDGRTWAITLYCGLIPLALALFRYWRFLPFRTGPFRHRLARLDGWDMIAPLGLVMAMGNLSIGAWIRWLNPQWVTGVDDLLLHPYGWLVTWLPGYAGFRYPAKWLAMVPLGIVIAAARQTGNWTPATQRFLSRIVLGIATTCFVFSAGVVLLLSFLQKRFPESLIRDDAIWGPMDISAACWSISLSMLVVVGTAKLFQTIHRRNASRSFAFHFTLVLIVLELGLIARTSLANINRDAEQRLIASVQTQDAIAPQLDHPSDLPLRAMRFSTRGWPIDLRHEASPGEQRLLLAEASMRNSAFGRWHLADDVAVFNSPTSLPPGRLKAFWTAANEASRRLPSDEKDPYWTRILRWLAIDQAWAVTESEGRITSDGPNLSLSTLRKSAVTDSSPVVTWHSDWKEIDVVSKVSAELFLGRLSEIVSDQPANSVPWLEMSRNFSATLAPSGGQGERSPNKVISTTISDDHIRNAAVVSVSYRRPGRWIIETDAPSEGLLCIKQYQDGNWRATIRSTSPASPAYERSVPVNRCDLIFSGIKIPSGQVEVILHYRPTWLTPTILAAWIAWMAVTYLVVGGQRFGRLYPGTFPAR